MTQQHFSTETYGLNAPENYERYFVPVIGEPLARDLIRQAALHPGEQVLDVACGTGIVARLAAQQVGETGGVAALDVNPGMLAIARKSASPDLPIEWHEAPAEAMPLADGTADVVLCQLGLQFMEDKDAALKEMNRVATTGGRLLLNVPGPAGKLFGHLAEIMEQTIGSEAAGFVNRVFSLHEESEIDQLLKKAGFQHIDLRAEDRVLSLPPPSTFLWQYIYSTPLAAVMANTGEELRNRLERKVVEAWQPFVEDGAFLYKQRIVTARATR